MPCATSSGSRALLQRYVVLDPRGVPGAVCTTDFQRALLEPDTGPVADRTAAQRWIAAHWLRASRTRYCTRRPACSSVGQGLYNAQPKLTVFTNPPAAHVHRCPGQASIHMPRRAKVTAERDVGTKADVGHPVCCFLLHYFADQLRASVCPQAELADVVDHRVTKPVGETFPRVGGDTASDVRDKAITHRHDHGRGERPRHVRKTRIKYNAPVRRALRNARVHQPR